MDKKKIKELIGEIGEASIHRRFNSIRPENRYDNTKDGIIGKSRYEVKTYRLHERGQWRNRFWVDDNKTNTQWAKMDRVAALFFVRIPIRLGEPSHAYLCLDHKTCFSTHIHDGKWVRTYPIEQCIYQYTLTSEEAKELQYLSSLISSYKG